MTRLLPVEEWPRLTGTLLDPAWTAFDPERDLVLVVERDGVIVGCTSFLPRWHMEGTWVAPSDRKRAGVGRALLRGMYGLAHALRAQELILVSVDPEISALCQRLGSSAVRMTGDHFSIGLQHAGPPISNIADTDHDGPVNHAEHASADERRGYVV